MQTEPESPVQWTREIGEAAFLAEVRGFLAEHWPHEAGGAGPRQREAAERRWFEALSARGWVVPHWPAAHGGTGWTARQRYLWEREAARVHAPEWDPAGTRVVGPLLCAAGSREQQRGHLPGIRAARVRWCLGLGAEPGVGAPVVATPVAGGYRLAGVQPWVDGASTADWLLCLAAVAAGGAGGHPASLSASLFVVDLHGAGVEVVPRDTWHGDGRLASVRFHDLRVPAAARVGAPGSAADWLGRLEDLPGAQRMDAFRLLARVQRLQAVLRASGTSEDELADLRRRLDDLQVELAGLEGLEARLLTGDGDGRALAQVVALRRQALERRLGELFVDALGYHALPFPDARLIDNEGPIGHHDALAAVREMLRAEAASAAADSLTRKDRIARMLDRPRG
jgi:alkylation response protein AidB-like acyl-CoA dehydrogenase